MKQNKLYNTAIYCRLSLDDGNEGVFIMQTRLQ